MSKEWIEVKRDKLEGGKATMRLFEKPQSLKGWVGVFSEAGYQKVRLETLPQEIQQQLKGELNEHSKSA